MKNSRRNHLPRLRSLAVAVHAAWGLSALALPQGATIVNGQVSITQPTAGSLNIKASNSSIINWQRFSIGGGELVQIKLPSADSSLLNRVTGAEMSQLLGQLQSNGQVFLINPNGIVVGGGARIDTNSFIGSTLGITDADFMAGKLRFQAGAQAASIRNEGFITAGPGGSVVLIAPGIENSGVIRAPDGNILLAAGRRMEITSLDLDGVSFEIQAPTDSVLNLGKLLAENGAVRAFAGTLRHSGEIRAERLVQDSDGTIVLAGSQSVTLTAESVTSASGGAGGQVKIQSSDGVARVGGQVTAAGQSGSGGDVRVLGRMVALEGGALIDASGATSGGQILVGGDFQGSNTGVQNAQRVFVAEGASLRADANAQGDGGRIIVWADENTRFLGELSARGGAMGGQGGFAEVSGKVNLEFSGSADLGAPKGAMGELLLDPLDIIISTTSGILPSVVDEFADFAANMVTISPAKLAAIAANVTLQAERDVYVKDAINLTAGGAGLAITAGGATFTAGSIYLEHIPVTRPGGITTAGGAVTLRAQSVSGPGTITTNGGAVDILTNGQLNYGSQIGSGGGAVTLGSQTSSVYGANVNAGSGTIQVAGQTGVTYGSYTTTGTANLTATTGGISVYDITAGVANLSAPSSINAAVDVTDRVNANSTGSYVTLSNNAAGPLRLGTVTGASGLYVDSSTGMAQAAGGLLTAPFFNFDTYGSAVSAGTVAAPLLLAAPAALVEPTVSVENMAVPAHLSFTGTTTVGGLSLHGTVAALGASTVAGSANITSLALGSASGALTVSAQSSAGLGSLLSLSVTDGGINAGTLNLQGGGGLYLEATGPVTIGSATTTRASGYGIDVYTHKCYYYAYTACLDQTPISAGILNAGAGNLRLRTTDNGDITVSGSLSANNVTLSAGEVYYSSGYPYYYQKATTNNIFIASATTSGSFSARNDGIGDIVVGQLAASGNVDVSAGNTYLLSGTYPSYVYETTANNIAITNAEPAGASGWFEVNNGGIGDVLIAGAIDRSTSGGIDLSAAQGMVTAPGHHSAYSSIDIYSGTSSVLTGNLSSTYGFIDVSGAGSVLVGNVTASNNGVSLDAGTTLTLGQLVSGTSGSYSNVDLNAGGDLLFRSVNVAGYDYLGYYGNVTLTSSTGTVRTISTLTTPDITATANVSISANDAVNGSIGNPAFSRPMDIKAGVAGIVTLSAGRDIGAAGKPVTIDTQGTIDVTSYGGQFHVKATDGTTDLAVSTVRLAGDASGIGAGSSSFRSLNLDINATSASGAITIGDPGSAGNLVQAAGALDEFRFQALGGSGLMFGDVSFTTDGANRLSLLAGNGLVQSTGNIAAGSVNLDGGLGNVSLGQITSALVAGNRITITGADVSTGDLSAMSLSVTGNMVTLGALTTSGTNRSTYYSTPDALLVTAAGDLTVNGAVNGPTAVQLQSTGGNVSVTGSVNAPGTSRYTYYQNADGLSISAAGNLTVGDAVSSGTSLSLLAGGNLTVGGAGTSAGVQAGSFYYTADNVNVTAGTASMLTVDAITGGYDKTVSAGVLNIATGVTGAAHDTTLTGTTFNTGHLTTAGTLTINASAAYAPVSALVGATTLSGNKVVINAAGDINVNSTTNNMSLGASHVVLNSTGGNVSAELVGTSVLEINTAKGFSVSTDTWMTDLSITASWDQALNGVGASVSSTTGSGSQSFGYGTDGQLYLNAISSLDAGRGWNLSYHDVSPNPFAASNLGPTAFDFVEPSFSHAGTGNWNVTFDAATVIKDASSSLGAVNLTLRSAGDIDLASMTSVAGNFTVESTTGAVNVIDVTTGGGSLSVTAAGNISVNTIDTSASSGGVVNLLSTGGDITRAAGSHLIHTASGSLSPVSGGSVSLSAASGRIGAAATPMALSYTASLSLVAANEIGVQADNSTLGSLSMDVQTGGTGGIALTGSNNFSGLGLSRVDAGANLALSALAPSALGSLSVVARGGGIKVNGDVSGVQDLTLDAKAGNVEVIGAGAAARSVAVSGSLDLKASQDVIIAAGAAATESVAITSGNLQLTAGQDIKLIAGLASVSASSSDLAYGQNATAGRDLLVSGGSGAGASAALGYGGSTSYQTLSAGRNLIVAGGSGSGASAQVSASNLYSQTINAGGNLGVLAGTGQDAFAKISQGYGSGTYYQSGSIGGNFTVQGGNASAGQGSGAYALFSGGQQSFGGISGNLLVAGGTATNNSALLQGAFDQTLGTVSSSGGSTTDSVSVQGGSGTDAFAKIIASGSQAVYAGKDRNNALASGDITVAGGAGTGAYAKIAAGSGQTLGSQADYCYYYGCYDPTKNLNIQGGTGSGAYAAVTAGGTQYVNAGGSIQVLGAAGAGAYGELATSGSQQIGSTSNSSNDSTDAILVQAGAGGVARIQAGGTQTIMSGGDLSVMGGTQAGMTASIESGGSQSIGNTYYYSNDASGSVMVQGGSATGAAAWIKAATGQTIDAGGNVSLAGGVNGAYAEISNTAGSQTVGNASYYYYDNTETVTLTGGSASGAYARIASGGSQSVNSAGDITLTGGIGSGSGGQLKGGSGQNITTWSNLTVTGGENTGTGLDATGIRNLTSGSQTLNVSGNLTLTGGKGAADTWIYQTGSGAQTITTGGDLGLSAPHASGAVTSIEAQTGSSSQTVNVGGAITIDNQAGWLAYIAAYAGSQTVTARSATISLAGAVGGAFAGISSATGVNQFVTLAGDGITAGSASLSISNHNATTNSRAAINSGGNLTLKVTDPNYDTAGAVQVGTASGLGASDISAAGDLTMVAGSLLVQGGANAAASASVNAPNTMVISTIYGPVQLIAGTDGSAKIDPASLAIVSNGSLLMTAGTNSSANTNINAGNFNLAVTSGDLTLTNSSAATSTITSSVFNFTGPNAVNLNGGTITASSTGTVNIAGVCNNCTTNLIGSGWTVNAYTPPPIDFASLVVGDILTLTDATGLTFELVVAEDGTLVLSNRRLNQCY